MPRGKYPRKKAAGLTSVQPLATEISVPLVVRKAKRVRHPVKPVVQLVAPEFLVQPNFYRNKRVAVDAISGIELKSYARSLGITQRDVDGLTEDRLRQNCKARIAESLAD